MLDLPLEQADAELHALLYLREPQFLLPQRLLSCVLRLHQLQGRLALGRVVLHELLELELGGLQLGLLLSDLFLSLDELLLLDLKQPPALVQLRLRLRKLLRLLLLKC